MSEESIDIIDSVVAAGEGPCWDGYKQVGMKEKDGRKVPNCVPVDASDNLELAAGDPCWDGYKQVGMKEGKGGKMVPNCVPVDASDASDDSEFVAKKKRTISQTPAPRKDNIKGSSKNKKGTAKGSGRKVVFSNAVETSLKNKVTEHNKKAKEGRRATLGMLKAVYRRGAGAYSGSHRPGMTRNQWAMGRVNAFIKILKSGKPSNPAYVSDNDLLPARHPRSSKKSASTTTVVTAAGLVPEEQELARALIEIADKYGKFNEDETGIWAGYTPPAENEVASIGVTCANCVLYLGGSECRIISLSIEPMGKCRFAVIPEGLVTIDKDKEENTEDEIEDYIYEEELIIEMKNKDDYESEEDAILAITEFSGYGYEAETAIKAAWLRGIRDGQDPFERALGLAEFGSTSIDANLLPIIQRGQ